MLTSPDMMDHDDARFSSFTRDLARRQRRPRSFPRSPTRPDALEQLCGGLQIIAPEVSVSMFGLPEVPSEIDLVDVEDDDAASRPS